MHAEHRHRRGFTLIEVLVSVLVLGLALLALTRTAATQVQTFGALRERTLAGWLAEDVLAQTRIANHFPATGRSDGQRRYAGRDWHWELDVQSTDVTTIRRLIVRVYAAEDRTAPLVELNGFGGEELQP
jgi:general secretion pathway protein I